MRAKTEVRARKKSKHHVFSLTSLEKIQCQTRNSGTQVSTKKTSAAMTSCLRVLSTQELDSFPSILLVSPNGKKILVNCGEGCQRIFLEHGQKVSSIDTVCLTHLGHESLGGLPGMILTASGSLSRLSLATDVCSSSSSPPAPSASIAPSALASPSAPSVPSALSLPSSPASPARRWAPPTTWPLCGGHRVISAGHSNHEAPPKARPEFFTSWDPCECSNNP